MSDPTSDAIIAFVRQAETNARALEIIREALKAFGFDRADTFGPELIADQAAWCIRHASQHKNCQTTDEET